MTISSTTRKAGPYNGTGAQTKYPFAFKVFAASDLLVVRTDTAGAETPLTLGGDYTVALNSDQDGNPGGTVTLLVPPPAGYLLTIGSAIPLTQGQSIPNMGGFYPKVIEQALDKLTIAGQQMAEVLGRCIRFGISDPGAGAGSALPAAAARSGKFLAFDAAGNPAAASGTGADAGLRTDLAASSGGSLLGFIVTFAGAVKRTILDKLRERVSVKDFGAKGDSLSDDTPALEVARTNGVTSFEIPQATYKINNFRTLPNAVYRGIGNPVMAFNFLSATVWLAFQSGSRYEGIVFQSNEADLQWQRGAIEDVSNVTIRDCALKGFRHASAAPNAWGLHIARSDSILIDNCEFADNSQSDIAITDSVRDVTIINAKNPTNGGVLLNIEPNLPDGVNGLNVVGGRYRAIYLQENDNSGYAGRNIVVTGARVDRLYYDGSGATFTRCDVADMTNAPDGVGAVYAGSLMIDTCDLGPNLLTDPYFFDVATGDANAFWAVFASGAQPYYSRTKDSAGKYLSINPNKINASYYVHNRTPIPVVAGENLMVFVRARCDNTSIAGVFTPICQAQWLNGAGAVISTTQVKICRGAFASFTDWKNDIALIVPPPGAVSMYLNFGSDGQVSPKVASAGLFRPALRRSGMGNMPEVIGRLSRPNETNTFFRTTAPNGALGYPGYFIGERIENVSGVVDQPAGWTFTALGGAWGDAGTWLPDPVIGTHRANFVGTTGGGASLATVETQLNALITELRAAKVVG